MRSHKSLGGSSAIGSPTTPINGVSVVNTVACAEGGKSVDEPKPFADVGVSVVVGTRLVVDGAVAAMVDAGVDVVDVGATAAPLGAPVVIAVVVPTASDLICADALLIMIAVQHAAITRGGMAR